MLWNPFDRSSDKYHIHGVKKEDRHIKYHEEQKQKHLNKRQEHVDALMSTAEGVQKFVDQFTNDLEEANKVLTRINAAVKGPEVKSTLVTPAGVAA